MPVPQEHSVTSQNYVSPLAQNKKQQLLLRKMRDALYEEKYPKYIEYLHALGRSFQKTWEGKSKNERKEFRQFIKEHFDSSPEDESKTLRVLCKSARNLEAIFTAWEDPYLKRSEEKQTGKEASKAERHRLKLKERIGKADRRAIHAGLFAAVADIVNSLEKTNATNQNVQEIKTALDEVVNGESKLDNIKLIEILKRIKSLNTKEKSVLKLHNDKFLKRLEKREKFNKELLQEIFTKIDETKQRSKALLKKPIDFNDEDENSNEALLEAMLFRINKRITEQKGKRKKSKKALLKKITDKVVKNIKDYEKLLKKVKYRVVKNEKLKIALSKKIEIAEENENEVDSAFLVEKKEYEKVLAENRKHTKALEQLQLRIKTSQEDSKKLLEKIYLISENKNHIQKLLKKYYGVKCCEAESSLLAGESTEKNQQIIANLKAAIKFKKVKKAIVDFKTTGNKVLSVGSFFIAFIGGLACGVVTGCLIFLLVTGLSFPLSVAALSVLSVGTLSVAVLCAAAVGVAGFYANFRFFSKTIPEFLLKLDRVTEYIDENGKRLPLPSVKKRLLLPIAFLVSACVGFSVGAFYTTTVVSLLAGLAVIWPPLPILLAGILTAGIGLSMCVVMFSAFARALQSPFSFAQLGKEFHKARRELTWKKGVGYVIKAVVIIFALLGLGCLCFTGAAGLAPLIGVIAAKCICAASLIGQIPFTIQTVSKFCDLIWNKLAGKSASSSHKENFLSQIGKDLGLVLNALGNAALVFNLTIQGWVSGAACFLNSFAGNLIKGDDKELIIRSSADSLIIQKLIVPASTIRTSANDGVYTGQAPLGATPTLPIPIPKNTDMESTNAWQSRHSNSIGRTNASPHSWQSQSRLSFFSSDSLTCGSKVSQTEEKPSERCKPWLLSK